MRKIYYYISAAVIALGLASCNKSEVDSANRQFVLVANTENSATTKTYLDGNDANGYRVLWSEGDKIILSGWTSDLEMTLTQGAGTTRGEFILTSALRGPEDGLYYAYYGTDGFELPSATQYVAENVISSAPMMAEVIISDGEMPQVDFKNICGLMRLTLKGSGTVKEIKVSAGQGLSGKASFSFYEGVATVGESGLKYVSQDCGDGVEITSEGTDFYIPMPQNEYTGLKIEITDIFNNTCTKTLKADKTLNVLRAKITPVSLTVSGLVEKSEVPDGALYGEFTVNAEGKKVYFSKGNMYWDGDSFEFEDHQYDVLKTWNSNHVGHLYWSRYAYRAYHDFYSTAWDDWSADDVLFTNMPKYSERPNKDFTVNDVTGKFRALSDDEWSYLFQHHDYKWVTIHNTKGYLIAPDGVELDKLSYDEEDLMADNLVFLPVTGYRVAMNMFGIQFNETSAGYYWSSSNGTRVNNAHALLINGDSTDEDAKIVIGYSRNIMNYACCIRLVADVALESSDIEKPEDGDTYDWE